MYKQEDWNNIVKLFIYDLSKDVSLDQALQFFASNYTEICQKFEQECSEDTIGENEEEPLDVYFERKMKPMWEYVYDLQNQMDTLNCRVGEIERVRGKYGQGVSLSPVPVTLYPNMFNVTCDAKNSTLDETMLGKNK